MLTDAQRTDCRRFCGYPAYGYGVAGNMGWRFYQAYGALEYRMSNLSDSEVEVATQFLVQLNAIESGIPAAAGNLDTDSAGAWTHNPNEVRDRTTLLTMWGRRLAAFLGVPPGPGLAVSGTQLGLVV